jgi:peptide-methionine (R)-S-oxide reductase
VEKHAMYRPASLFSALLLTALSACGQTAHKKSPTSDKTTNIIMKEPKSVPTKEELRQRLTDEQWHITQEKGTERAFTGKYWDHHEKGTYRCVCCGLPLFLSDTKFESGCGWPSFFQAVKKENVRESLDTSYGMIRTEITCGRCGAHLGHVFNDGPEPTGLRYCLNSGAMRFEAGTGQ